MISITNSNSIQEYMKIDLELVRQAISNNFWARKTMVGSEMFCDAKIAELKSPEQAFSAFSMQIVVK